MTRNPRDACVSYYNFLRVTDGYSGTLEDFVDSFLNDMAGYYTPFFVHVLSYWNQRYLPNICFITYEEMKVDLPAVVQKLAAFLGKPLPQAEAEMLAFMDHLSFNKMKSNAAVNKADILEVFHHLRLTMYLHHSNTTFYLGMQATFRTRQN